MRRRHYVYIKRLVSHQGIASIDNNGLACNIFIIHQEFKGGGDLLAFVQDA